VWKWVYSSRHENVIIHLARLNGKTPQTNKTTFSQWDWLEGWEWQLKYVFKWPWQHLYNNVYNLVCECDRCRQSENNSYIERKTFKFPKPTHKNDVAINMPKYNRWLIKWIGCENSTRAHGMSPTVCNQQGKNQGRLQNLDVGQNFQGCCSLYNRTIKLFILPLRHDISW